MPILGDGGDVDRVVGLWVNCETWPWIQGDFGVRPLWRNGKNMEGETLYWGKNVRTGRQEKSFGLEKREGRR